MYNRLRCSGKALKAIILCDDFGGDGDAAEPPCDRSDEWASL